MDDVESRKTNEETQPQVPGDARPSPKKKRKKGIIVGAVAVVVVAAGAGFWAWHETPGFCASVCHYSMDAYLDTYEQQAGVAGFDKYGNDVSDTNALMAVSHKASGAECLDCHVPVLAEQVGEAVEWVTGNYEVVGANTRNGYALASRSFAELTAARGSEPEEFCLNESCHNITREELTEATSDLSRNPHETHHGEIDCGTCHKGHAASVMYCSQCHDDAALPSGWLTWDEYKGLEYRY